MLSILLVVLHTEVTPPASRRPISPTRPTVHLQSFLALHPLLAPVPPSCHHPHARRCLFTYNSPSTSNPATPTRRLDTPTDEAYSMSPVRAASRQLLESSCHQLRSVCKTPYRVTSTGCTRISRQFLVKSRRLVKHERADVLRRDVGVSMLFNS
jgi:cell division cycle 20-like protein 1 (cofactor of APC complex)